MRKRKESRFLPANPLQREKSMNDESIRALKHYNRSFPNFRQNLFREFIKFFKLLFRKNSPDP